MWLIPAVILLVGFLSALFFLEPLLGIATVAFVALSICDIYFDVLYRRLGSAVLRSLSAGRFPPPVPSRNQSLLASFAGLATILVLLGALLLLVGS